MSLLKCLRLAPLALTLALGLAACSAYQHSNEDLMLDATLRSYANALRWGEIDQAVGFISPADLEAHPIPDLEMERYRQVRIVGYQEQGVQRIDQEHARQTVSIEVVNQHTQVARNLVDHQEWRYDPVTKHWWLTSGLPKITSQDTR